MRLPLAWPILGPGPQARLVPWLGIKLMTLCCTDWHSIHWATPARALSILWWNVCLDLLPFLNWAICLLVVEFEQFPVYVGCKYFIRYAFYKYFLPVCGLSAHSLNSAFPRAKVFILIKSNLILSLMDHVFGVLAKKVIAR